MTIVERIESKRAKIQKLEALIERKNALLAKKSDGFDRDYLQGEIEDRQRDIADLKKEIEALIPVLEEFKRKQDMIGDLRKVLGPFMDDLEKTWNEYDEMMLGKVTPRRKELSEAAEQNFNEYYSYLASMNAEEADKEYWNHQSYRKFYSISEGQWNNEWRKNDYCRDYANRRVAEDVDKHMTDEFRLGWKKYIYNCETEKDVMLRKFFEENHKTVESLVLDLQNRIAYKVGEITDYSHLKVDMKALNGVVTGQLGTCRVESILAGGYNIQRLHVRVLVK